MKEAPKGLATKERRAKMMISIGVEITPPYNIQRMSASPYGSTAGLTVSSGTPNSQVQVLPSEQISSGYPLCGQLKIL